MDEQLIKAHFPEKFEKFFQRLTGTYLLLDNNFKIFAKSFIPTAVYFNIR